MELSKSHEIPRVRGDYTDPPGGRRSLQSVHHSSSGDEAVVGFDGQPVSQVFGDDKVERTLDSFRFCLCSQRPLGALELSRV
jgi:hypothetical protein